MLKLIIGGLTVLLCAMALAIASCVVTLDPDDGRE